MSNAESTILIDFGHRTATITVGDVRGWLPWTEDTITAACKALRIKSDVEKARQCAQDIISDVASQTAGCQLHECVSCGAQSYGSDAGEDLCEPCFELGGWDNQLNDDGATEIDKADMAAIRELTDAINEQGGDVLKALSTCDYISNVGVKA
jgi:hypothetical protein